MPAFRAHDAARHTLAQAERATDSQHEVADLQLIAIAELGRFETAGIDRERGDVGFTIAPHLLRVKNAAVVKVDGNPLRRRVADDVAIGEDVNSRAQLNDD